jgi:hypothetical protein
MFGTEQPILALLAILEAGKLHGFTKIALLDIEHTDQIEDLFNMRSPANMHELMFDGLVAPYHYLWCKSKMEALCL